MNNNKWYQKWMAIDQFSCNNVCFVLQLHNNLCNTGENYEISDNFLGNWHCLSPYDAFSHNLPSNLSVVMPQHDEIRNLDLRDVTFIDATEQIRFRRYIQDGKKRGNNEMSNVSPCIGPCAVRKKVNSQKSCCYLRII